MCSQKFHLREWFITRLHTFARVGTCTCNHMPLLKGPGLLGSVLEVIEKLRLIARRSVLIWVNCWKDIFITHFFLSVILVALCYFVLLIFADQFIEFSYMSLFVKSKDLLYEFLWIFFTRRNSSGVMDSKILPYNNSMLLLSLSHITW